jgi:DNA integrity scanning protein DisA with diadenylate cyclase activity
MSSINTPINNSSTFNEDSINTAQSTLHTHKGEWYPYNKDEESEFLPFTSFENAEQQLTYEYLISIGTNVIQSFASMWYHYYQRINKTKYLNIIDHDKIFLLNAFLEKQYNNIKIIENCLNHFAIESNCPPFFPNSLNDKKNMQIITPTDTQPTFQVHFPTFGQDHNSIKDLQEFLDQFENAIEEAKINPLKY